MSRADTQPPRWFLRTAIVVTIVPFFTWTLLRRVWVEVRSIPFYVRLDWAEDWAILQYMWRTGRLYVEGEENDDGR